MSYFPDSRNSFESDIRRILENHEAPFNPDDWALLEAKLNDQKKPAVPPPLFNWRIGLIFAGVLFFSLFAGKTLYNRRANPTNILTEMGNTKPISDNASILPTSPANLSAAQSDNLAKDTPNLQTTSKISESNPIATAANKQANPYLTASADKFALPKTSAHVSKTTQKNQAAADNSYTNAATVSNLNSAAQITNVPKNAASNNLFSTTNNNGIGNKNTSYTGQSTNNKIPISPQSDQPPTEANTNQTETIHNNLPPDTTPDTNPATTKNTANEAVMAQKSNEAAQQNTPTETATPNPPTAPEASHAKPKAVKKPHKGFHAFYIGAFTSSDGNFVSGRPLRLGNTSGFNLNWQFHRNWSIESGVGYAFKNYQFSTLYKMTPIYPQEYEKSQAHVEMVEIPIILKFHFGHSNGASPYIGIGNSIFIPTKQHYDYVPLKEVPNLPLGADSANYITPVEDYPSLSTIWKAPNIRAGITFDLSRRMKLNIESQFKTTLDKYLLGHNLPTIQDAGRRYGLYSFGVQVGVSYKF